MTTGQYQLGRRLLLVVLASVTLSACAGDNDELRAYIDEVKARPGGRIPPLPDIVPAPKFVYNSDNRRSPFVPDLPQVRVSNNPDAVEGPDPNRPREFLEQFPLDTLRMVGTLELGGSAFGRFRRPTAWFTGLPVEIISGRTTDESRAYPTQKFSWWRSFLTALGGILSAPQQSV